MNKNNLPVKIFSQIDEISEDMERLFYHLFCPKGPAKSPPTAKWHPLVDILEAEDRLVIKVELAGVEKNDINISLEKNCLYISGKRKEILPPDVKCYHQMEINYGEFERILPLKDGITKSSIEAKFGNGFLTIIIHNKPRENGKRSIKVDVK